MSVVEADDTALGFIDVAANALAMMILATLFVIILSAAPPRPGSEVVEDKTELLNIPVATDYALSPNNRYFIVQDAGIADVALDPFVDLLARGQATAVTELGSLSVVVPRRGRRDYDEYRAFYRPNVVALAAVSAPIASDEQVAKFVADLEALHAESNIAGTFFVTTDGLETFAPVYWELRGRGLPLRWRSLAQGQEIVFTQKPADFTGVARKW